MLVKMRVLPLLSSQQLTLLLPWARGFLIQGGACAGGREPPLRKLCAPLSQGVGVGWAMPGKPT